MSQASFDDLAGLLDFLDKQAADITALVQEIEEVQGVFETRFVEARGRAEDLRSAVTAQLARGQWQQPSWLIKQIEARTPSVEKNKRERQAELQKQLADLQQEMERTETKSGEMRQRLQETNPRLNSREEELKQQQAALTQQISVVQGDLKQAGRGLGWLLRAGQVHERRQKLDELALQLYAINERLTEVRQSWKDLDDKTDDGEQSLQDTWRQQVAEIARLKAEQAALQRDFASVCREQACDQVLTALETAQPCQQADLDQLLTQLLDWQGRNRDYEAGVAAVSELMGLLKGICEGLGRLAESVQGVKDEQDMHAELANLKLQVPAGCLEFHALWGKLRPVVLDEKQAAEHPQQFSQKLKATIGDQLSADAVDAMFTGLGEELNRATAQQW